MSGANKEVVKRYALRAIQNLIPLDEETISQMVDYAMTQLKSREDVNQHFINLLGESPDALEFISKFNALMFPEKVSNYAAASTSNVPRTNITGVAADQSSERSPSPATKNKPAVKALRLVPGANGKSKATITRVVTASESQKGKTGQQRLSKNSSGTTTSDLLDLKPSTITKKHQYDEFNKKNAKKKLNDLKDLDAALAELEYKDVQGTSSTQSSSPSVEDNENIGRSCNCMATRHPLFEMFPNCLNCGKIICAREGLQPCSFCGRDLLTNDERLQILTILQEEKDALEGKKKAPTASEQPTKGKKKAKITYSITELGTNGFKVQDQFFKKAERIRELERKKEEKEQKLEEERIQVQKELDYYASKKNKDEDLNKAQERLDRLLSFQANGAERTKIIDQTSDFDTTGITNLWASPIERALQLKRQQKMRRKMEEAENNRRGRGKRVMELSVVNGSVQTREVTVNEEDGNVSSDEEVQELSSEISKMKMKEEGEKSNNVYDYEKEMNKWEKPVYIGDTEDKDASNDYNKENKTDIVPTTSKVQFGDNAEDEIFGLIGI